MHDADLLAWLASVPPRARDAAVEEYLGIARPAPCPSPPGDHLVGHHAGGVASVVRMLLEVPVVVEDVVIDLGAGLGKVVLLTRLLTGATARGIELQPALVERARAAAARRRVDVTFLREDVRQAELGDGTVFFMYLPFTGPALKEVLLRLEAVASRRAIVVCALGLELDREAPWLVRRPMESFWLTLYDSVVPGAAPGPHRPRSPLSGHLAEAVAFDRLRTSPRSGSTPRCASGRTRR